MDAKNEKSSFSEMWYLIFVYDLATSVFIHCIVALLSFCSLRKHKYSRFFPILVIIVGFLFPVTGGIITSALISLVYQSARLTMPNYVAFLWGGGQAFALFLVSYTRILATL
ncbi:transmembrane 170A [Paramuricea clavata]|uniref:Transmembrane 170A n=1 Tax=Paramuricea clavata TaxID=317549 RepID=A0A7D9D543_PARCT|nr:transmembrane 170A [Paramuricea clavata]